MRNVFFDGACYHLRIVDGCIMGSVPMIYLFYHALEPNPKNGVFQIDAIFIKIYHFLVL